MSKRLWQFVAILVVLCRCGSVAFAASGTFKLHDTKVRKTTLVSGDVLGIENSADNYRIWYTTVDDIKNYVLADVVDFSATSPLNFNSTTGVLSLTPWASQSAFETAMGWTISGSGGGITVSSTLPTTTGSATLNDSTHILTVASDTGYTQFTGSFTAWDTAPAAFGFGTITDAVAGQEYCWTTPITVAGINRPVTVSSTADSYKINGASSTETSISLGDTFTPCMIAPSTAGATVSGNMTVGGVVGDPVFSVTTADGSDSCAGFAVCEDFSGTGTPDGVSVVGSTFNFDVATNDFSLSPGEYLSHTSIADSTEKYIKKSHASLSTVYAAILVRTNSLPSDGLNIGVIENGSTLLAIVRIQPSGSVEAMNFGGASVAEATPSFASGTELFLKWRYVAGAGSDARLTIWTSPDGIAWTERADSTNGASILPATSIAIAGLYNGTASYDVKELRVKSNDFNF